MAKILRDCVVFSFLFFMFNRKRSSAFSRFGWRRNSERSKFWRYRI